MVKAGTARRTDSCRLRPGDVGKTPTAPNPDQNRAATTWSHKTQHPPVKILAMMQDAQAGLLHFSSQKPLQPHRCGSAGAWGPWGRQEVTAPEQQEPL